jgi:putative permease
MPTRKLEDQLRREWWLKLTAVLGVMIIAVVLVFWIDNLLVSFVLAFVTNYLLAPIVSRLESVGVPRNLAILIPFLGAGVLIGVGVSLILPVIVEQSALLEGQIPQYQTELMALMQKTELRLQSLLGPNAAQMSQRANEWILLKTTELSATLPSAISGSITVLILTPFLAYFMLQDGRKITRGILSMVPNSLFELVINLHHQINDQMGGFIRARFFEAAIVGLVVWAGLAIIGFPFALVLAIFAAVTNLIPYLGPIIGAIPAIIIALVSTEGHVYEPMSVNLFVITTVYFVAQLIDVVFIIPFVVARIVNLHPVTVLLVIIIGAQFMGILGMVISIPIASAAKLTITALYDHLLDFRA